MTVAIFSGFSENPRDSGFFSLGIFIPGIRDFFWFRDLYPRDSVFFLNTGFLSAGFFRGIGYSDKRPPVIKNGHFIYHFSALNAEISE